MSEATRALIVEDLPTDAELCEREVRRVLPRCEFRRVETPEMEVRYSAPGESTFWKT